MAMRTDSRGVHFAVCVKARAADDLEVGKVFRILPDTIRPRRESGEDYLYSASRFVVVDVPKGASEECGDRIPSRQKHYPGEIKVTVLRGLRGNLLILEHMRWQPGSNGQ